MQNPFNGIERSIITVQSPAVPEYAPNPFNGIERCVSEVGGNMEYRVENPFNGIESLPGWGGLGLLLLKQ